MPFQILRKSFLLFQVVSALVLLQCADGETKVSTNPFPYGIASGEPTPQGFTIWAKMDSLHVSDSVQWEIAGDSLFSKIDRQGTVFPDKLTNGTVKELVNGLQPATEYYYRFSVKGKRSMTGRSKTLPNLDAFPDNFNIAFVSCNNYQDGYFNAFGALSEVDDIDLVVHLGDYIYEYEAGRYADTTLTDRSHEPRHEVLTLDDYRTRYAQYRSDANLQKVHAKFPFLFIWDDHEFANDAYKSGAKNHSPEEGDWQKRRSSAEQAYMEWMPLKKSPSQNPPTQISIGKLMELVLLEERTSSRSKQVVPCESESLSENHTLLGQKQLEILESTIRQNEKPWTVIANQVAFSGYAKADSLFPPKYQDWWLGYPNDRNRIVKALSEAKNKPIIVTGDHHRSFVMAIHEELTGQDNCAPSFTESHTEKPLAWEVMIPSITSKNHDAYMDSIVSDYTRKLVEPAINPHIKYVDLKSHGFTILHFTPDKVSAEYVFMKTIKQKDAAIETVKNIELNY